MATVDRERDRPSGKGEQVSLAHLVAMLVEAHDDAQRALSLHAEMKLHAADYVAVGPRLRATQDALARVHARVAECEHERLSVGLGEATPADSSWFDRANALTSRFSEVTDHVDSARSLLSRVDLSTATKDYLTTELKKLSNQAHKLQARLEDLEIEAGYQQEEDDAQAAEE